MFPKPKKCALTSVEIELSIVINGEPVEQVDSFKYLGVILDEKLSFTNCIKCKTSRYSRSFVPVAIRMLNAKPLM